MNKHILKNLAQLERVAKNVNVDSISRIFLKHKRVIFCTMGKSAFACRKIVFTARSYGLDWHDLDVCHAFHGDAGIIKDGDLLVFVSKSGETEETNRVAKYFKKWSTVAITSDSNSSLSNTCKLSLTIPVEEEGSPFGYAPMISTSMYMIVLHSILCHVVDNSDINIENYARNHPDGSIGRMLKNVKL